MTPLELGLKPLQWDALKSRIQTKRVTPIVSSRLFDEKLPGQLDLLKAWSEKIEYPQTERLNITDLIRYTGLQVKSDTMAIEMFLSFCRDYLHRRLIELEAQADSEQSLSDSIDLSRIYSLPWYTNNKQNAIRLLAQLDAPIYITTSHHHLLEHALSREGKEPQSDTCFWRERPVQTPHPRAIFKNRGGLLKTLDDGLGQEDVQELCYRLGKDYENVPGGTKKEKILGILKFIERIGEEGVFISEVSKLRPQIRWERLARPAERLSIFERDPSYEPTVKRPLVYHIFGLDTYPETLVLTEDDYLDFLTQINWINKEGISYKVREALAATSLVMLGFNVQDWDFKILFRGLIANGRRPLGGSSVSVQLEKEAGEAISELTHYHQYLRDYFSKQAEFSIYWGEPDQFMRELWSYLK